MIWVRLAIIFLCTRYAIAEIRNRDDWSATFCIVAVLLNIAAIARS